MKSCAPLLIPLAAPWITHAETTEQQPPNIIFVFIDDMGWKDAGFMGSTYYETPRIDRLASEGMMFTQAYANAPNCAPSRACLMSGTYSPRHSIYTVGNPARGQDNLRKLIPAPRKESLDLDIVTMAEALKPAGYINGMFGKWHLGKDEEHSPLRQGFDVCIMKPEEKIKNDPKHMGFLTDSACAFMETNKTKSFFLYLAHHAVHLPIQAKTETIEKYNKKQGRPERIHPEYAAMVEDTDTCVGRLLDKIDKLGLRENTMVVFFSDNGGHDAVTSMTPLRGSKGQLYEGGIRVPLIVRWPGKVRPGSSCDTPVIGTDFFPTFLKVAGTPTPSGKILDGVSLLPLLTQTGELKPRALFWHFPVYLQGYTERQGAFRTRPVGAVRMGDWKLLEYFEDGRLELYNLKDDIGETINLAEKMPEETKELHRIMQNWRKHVNAFMPTEKNPDYDPNATYIPPEKERNVK